MYVASFGRLAHADTSAATARSDSKLVQLEALRGLAAFIVVAWHFLWAFDPARIGIVDGFDPSAAMLGSVGFASIDGPAAVTLFFVLSGFVLPLGFFRSGRTELVVRATAKRWLRLVCLVMLAVLLSWLLFRCGLYRHREAAQLSQSAWLGTFGGSHQEQSFTPSLFGAMLEGSLFAFLREPDMYDPVLWTMHHEFIGSFVTFFLATTLVGLGPDGSIVSAAGVRDPAPRPGCWRPPRSWRVSPTPIWSPSSPARVSHGSPRAAICDCRRALP